MKYLRNYIYKYKKYLNSNLAVLCFHRVKNYKMDPINITVSNENFSNQIKWLSLNTNIISPDQLETNINRGQKLPKRSVLLTFDDGYSNYKENMQLLKSKSISAIFFISTPKYKFYWDTLTDTLISPKLIQDKYFNFYSRILNRLNYNIKIERELDNKSIGIIRDWKLPNNLYPFERCRAFSVVSNALQNENPFKKDSIYNELRNLSSPPSLNVEKLLIEDSLIKYHTIGAHTCNHFNLSKLSYQLQKEEIEKNKMQLESIINGKVNFFAYPYGERYFYNETSLSIVKDNFKFAFSNFPGLIHNDSNHYELPRFIVRDWDLSIFKNKLLNFFNHK
tara:strand:+ start:728 stop:1732 length:1005 start_codon:yes stop_codon:yes gene_type:complete